MINVSDKFSELFVEIEREFDDLSELVSSVEIMSDHKLYSHYLMKVKSIEDIAKKIKELKRIEIDHDILVELKCQGENISDDEIEECLKKKDLLENEIKEMIAEKKQRENEKISIEINSKEDSEFCEIVVAMFEEYSKSKDYKFEKELNPDAGYVLNIQGDGVYDQFKMFSGKAKRVVRGEESYCLIVVLKNDFEEIEIDEKDLIIQTSKSSGAGGQHINKTESAVKITHVPTGIFAECQDERSQTKNKEKAMEWLKKKIAQKQEEKFKKSEKNQRNELKTKIFGLTPTLVFDYDLNKVILTKDKTEYKLKEILSGDLGLIINNQIN